MTPEQFCYWMQGFVELSGGNPPTTQQWQSISEHLQQVFKKKTPTMLTPATTTPAVPPQQTYPWPGTGAPWIKPTDVIC